MTLYWEAVTLVFLKLLTESAEVEKFVYIKELLQKPGTMRNSKKKTSYDWR